MSSLLKRKKICFYIGDIHGNGGISRVTWILANKLNKYFEIHVLSYYKNPHVKYVYSDDIKQDFLFEDKKSIMNRFFKTVKGIRRYIVDNEIDLVITAGTIHLPPSSFAVKRTKAKLVYWEHGNTTVKCEHRFQNLCRYLGAKKTDAAVVLTQKDKSLYDEKYKTKNCYSIYNPIDDKLITDVSYNADSKKIISVGRLCYAKNFELLVEIADIVLRKYPEWSWDIYGEGECRASIEEKIREYKIGDKLHLAGNVSDLYDRYQGYSFLVMTSRYEGFPMTLLESTAKGLPSISFDILTGPNEIIVDEKTGYLVEAKNVQAMAEKISWLIENAETRKQMSENCVERRKRFTTDVIVEEWKELIETLVLWN